jgi:hypothetical protein
VEEVAAPAQHLDHPGHDRAIRDELAGDDPTDARSHGKGKVDRSVPPRHVQGGAVHPDEQLDRTEARSVAVAGWFAATCGRKAVRSDMVIESGVVDEIWPSSTWRPHQDQIRTSATFWSSGGLWACWGLGDGPGVQLRLGPDDEIVLSTLDL